MAEKIYFVVMVPMVYVAVLIFVAGIAVRVVGILTAPRHPSPLCIYPKRGPAALVAFWDTFGMPQVRRHAPLFWIFLILYHLAFLLLILAHLDLFPGIHIMPADSPHMLGWGVVGVVVTVAVIHFLIRRFRSPVRDISTFADYLLLMLLLLTFLSGDTISWANSWNQDSGGFVLAKEDFGAYLQSLLAFRFADPQEVLGHPHYIIPVIHVFLANLFLILFPFTKFMHTFLAMPINLLRRG
jgi:nitrate reductase gamma subunit